MTGQFYGLNAQKFIYSPLQNSLWREKYGKYTKRGEMVFGTLFLVYVSDLIPFLVQNVLSTFKQQCYE